MPSALRSGGGSVLGSTPGPAFGEPLSATYSDLPSGLGLMPRGRLPSGAVAITACVVASMTVRSPDASLVTNTRTAGGAAGAVVVVAAGGGAASRGAPDPQADAAYAPHAASAAATHRYRLLMGVMISQRQQANRRRSMMPPPERR